VSLSYKEVAEILKIIDASECEEVILELEGARLVVRRGAGGTGMPAAPLQSPGPAPARPAPAAQAHAAAPAKAAQPATAADSAGGTVIRAPMVGTFYRRPAPDQPAFVEVGTKVKAGDALCLIEVMKLYTTIETTTAGTVSQIAVEDGQLVEFNQPLFTIQPA
jgi:acetyl-CoA carboxylase biotin carboxyl carrier protein